MGSKVKRFDPEMPHRGTKKAPIPRCAERPVTLSFLQSNRFSQNASLLDSSYVQQAAAMLANATLHTEKYYGSDVKVAYRLVQSLLQRESSQQGFNLTATQDVHFTEVRPDADHSNQRALPFLYVTPTSHCAPPTDRTWCE